MSFAAPAVLFALVALPAIWLLLRIVPPKPHLEVFPPTRLLAEVARKEETPSRTPWWLTAIRILLATLLIVALADPILSPSSSEPPGEGPLLLVVDNGWDAAGHWQAIARTAEAIITSAGEAERPVALVATADPPADLVPPSDSATAIARLAALAPRPYAADFAALVPQLSTIAESAGFGGAVWLSGGLGGAPADAFAAVLGEVVDGPVLVYADPDDVLLGLAPPANAADAMTVPVIRQPGGAEASGTVRAVDLRGRVVAEARFSFADGATEADAVFDVPAELRNEMVRLEIAGVASAGAVQLLDERNRRRTIGIVAAGAPDPAQPLLAPEYYIARAVEPFADLWASEAEDVDRTIDAMIDTGLSIIVLADIGTMAEETEERLAAWVDAGGTLVRFAGSRLAAADTALLPVTLRGGGRALGGALSWDEPQPLGAFPASGPFADLAVPGDVSVERQVLAEPDEALSDRTWAVLADGTPLVTGAARGEGLLVLFHVTADASWSNLPLSGVFPDMLQRIAGLAAASDTVDGEGQAAAPPYRVLDGYGRWTAPDPEVEPLPGAGAVPGAAHPPGLYGTEDVFRAVSLLAEGATLTRLDPAALGGARPYPDGSPVSLRSWLLLVALAVLLLDALAVLWIGGALHARRAGVAIMVAGALMLGGTPDARAQTGELTGDALALAAANETSLAYVRSGDPPFDEISRAGLQGLSYVLAQRTAFVPGPPIGVDIATDELAFFPLLYWRIDPDMPMPDADAIARIEAYMRNGGSVLVDTADQLERTAGGPAGETPAGAVLQATLAGLDLPALEPVPPDHVLGKTFYILSEFPGRYAGGDLWLEALPSVGEPVDTVDRPARAGDDVSSIFITSNDFAAAWAVDENGAFVYPMVGSDRQRELAFRAGVNLVMYVLTGNYKADQVHVPALLDRLGQ